MNMMNDGMNVEQRDIVFVLFQYVELDKEGKRPAFVVSDNEYHQHSEDMIICAITSKPRPYKYAIDITTADLENGELRYDSKIKPTKISTIKQSKILFKIGKLKKEKSEKVIENINKIIKIKN